jgi:RNA-directed DNA polymerase
MEKHTHLMEQIAAPENLLAAWRAVRGNIPRYRRARSHGPDGVSLVEFERDLPAQLHALSDMLRSGRFQPEPPLWFETPKRSGGIRRLAQLSVRERVAQRAAQQVLEPLWEPVFLDCSFGFRPGLSRFHAVRCIQSFRRQGLTWVVDGDIAACFDSLDHDILMRLVRTRIADPLFERLLQAWLDAGLMQAGPPSDRELPPGSPGSALANPGWAQRGLGWLVAVLDDEDPYAAGYYELPPEDSLPGSQSPDGGGSWELRYPGHANRQQRALRRVLLSGAMWGASWARPALALLRRSSQTVLATPAGRRLLHKSAYAAGGLAGVAAAAAVTALVLQKKAGPSPTGVLQGSPLSPLLANIYLHPFDRSMLRSRHRLVRYADDWVVLCPTQESAESAFNEACINLARLRLKLNPEKSRILSPDERLVFLGETVD